MKSIPYLILAASYILFNTSEAADNKQQGGNNPGHEKHAGGHEGGHEGGHGGGGQRNPAASHPSARTPSMSRAQVPRGNINIPVPKGEHHEGSHHPVRAGQSAPAVNHTAVKQQLGTYLQRFKRPENQQASHQRGQDIKNNFAQHRQRFTAASQNTSNRIRQQHPNYSNWFNQNTFHQHHYYPHYWHQGTNWWKGPGWGGIRSWTGWTWAAPIYYDNDGSSFDVTDGENYAAETSGGAEGDWLPLGVFAAGQDPNQAAYSNMFVQLAVDRDGDLDGTYYNAGTESYYPLEGYVDQGSQQAVWRISNNESSPVMTTGIYNLTQDEANVLVNFPDGTTQSWILVRVNAPS